jgi:hypothetical protein
MIGEMRGTDIDPRVADALLLVVQRKRVTEKARPVAAAETPA